MTEKSIILLGIKHSGKSTQGRLLSEHYSCPFVDIDDVITEMNGKTPREIYTEKGPAGFMEAEEKACLKTVSEYTGQKIVIATGGGICDNEPALIALRPFGTFVFIMVSEKISCDRILKKVTLNPDGSFTGLPAYIAKQAPKTEADIRKIFHKFYEARTEIYKSIADITVDTKDLSKTENAKNILSKLEE